jgi:CRISPR-associated protein Cmr6
MVRAWAEQWTDTSLEDIRRIFGPGSEDLKKNKDLKANVGSVIFLDALPQKTVSLKADIMTPHYSDYYAGKKDKQGNLIPPADWHSPTPIPFLVVKKDQTFVFGILPRHTNEQGQKDYETVKGWLKEALCWTGAGAKTAVGYGRFAVDETAQAEAEKERSRREKEAQLQAEQQKREAALRKQTEGKSELYAELLRQSLQNRWTEPAGKDSFVQMDVIEDWIEKLENDPKLDAIQHLAELISTHFPRLLDNPNAMGGKKNDTPVFKERQRKFANRLLALLRAMQ